MIEYYKGFYGLNLLFRIHGSAILKACVPSLISVGIYFLYRHVYSPKLSPDLEEDLGHPYAVGVLMTGVSFLIVFRANYGYQRYWEACGAVHQMMSKWLDGTVSTALFHMQCSHYDHIKPPSLFDHPEFMMHNLSVDRERIPPESRHASVRSSVRSIEAVDEKKKVKQSIAKTVSDRTLHPNHPSIMFGPGRADGGWGLLFNDSDMFLQTPPNNGNEHHSWALSVTPSLFLQELAHLSSLCVAVAFCTLRNDVDGSVSPLGTYIPGSKWPEADPDMMDKDLRHQFLPKSIIWKLVRYIFGLDRTDVGRTQYNAARPMPVLGGVSNNEIKLLQQARGASAKTTLAWYWLSEFITREHLAGSTGKVGPPIISRIHQFLSDGMIFYNHARKIMYIPFPFPHAQISAYAIFVMMVYVPFMMEQYTEQEWAGASLTFFTVLCLAGLHEVARELENPFRNAPNDIPLCTLLAFYNEALVSMCSGFHPDHYWNAKAILDERKDTPQAENGAEQPRSETSSMTEQDYQEKIRQLEDKLKDYHVQLESLRTTMKNKIV